MATAFGPLEEEVMREEPDDWVERAQRRDRKLFEYERLKLALEEAVLEVNRDDAPADATRNYFDAEMALDSFVKSLLTPEQPDRPKTTTSPTGVRQTTPSEILGSEKGQEQIEKTAKLYDNLGTYVSHHEGDFR